ncbi:hypothetical protein [Hwanghaeella sp.]|uniref:hypothetical protein n=1 Tax=Hwanghaeella sp. TaxID=2605943 RepID=UPI003CCBD4EB
MTDSDLILIAAFPGPYKSAFGTMRREPTPQENIALKRLAAEGYLERTPQRRGPDLYSITRKGLDALND